MMTFCSNQQLATIFKNIFTIRRPLIYYKINKIKGGAENMCEFRKRTLRT